MIESPESVSRVMPPTGMIRRISRNRSPSQRFTAVRDPRRAPSMEPPTGAVRVVVVTSSKIARPAMSFPFLRLT